MHSFILTSMFVVLTPHASASSNMLPIVHSAAETGWTMPMQDPPQAQVTDLSGHHVTDFSNRFQQRFQPMGTLSNQPGKYLPKNLVVEIRKLGNRID